MSWDNRVVWTEGMFLRTQHFQQADRYVERLVRDALGAAGAYLWGVSKLEFDEDLLKLGRIALANCQGVLDDGAPFDIPGASDHPAPLEPPADLRNAVIYLGAPVRRPGGVDTALTDDTASEARFRSVETDAPDTTAAGAMIAPIAVGKLNLRLFHERQDVSGYSVIPIARMIERRSDDSITLDPNFIPSALACAASPKLTGFLSEVRGLLHHRGEAIAARLGESSAGGVAEITDFLLLQTVNRHEALLRHMASLPALHPERLFETFAALAGELATFTEQSNRPQEFPPYVHRNLEETFAPVMDAIRASLSAVFEQNAVAIQLETRRYGIRVGKIADKSLFEDATFVLAAKAAIDTEALRGNLPKRITIGAVERIRDLVNLQLSGAPMRPLAAEPRQIPYRAGVVYFEINAAHEEWAVVRSSGGVAMHVSGDVPDLELSLWAIRGRR